MHLFNQKNSKASGFTLIELLVVIAIIAILSTLSIIALSVARSKSRDARRLADIRQIATALEMYKDTNGDYPSANSIGNPWNADSFNYNAWISLNQYLSRYFENGVMPKDPKNDSSYSYRYEITPDHSLATLTYSLENDNPNLLDTPSFYSNSVRYYIKAMYR